MVWEEHIASYTKKIQQNPNDKTAYWNRGETYLNLKQYELAIQDFSKVIELCPNFELMYYKRGLAYSCLKQYKKANQDFERCTIWHYDRGQDYYELEQYELAIRDFNKAIERDSDDVVSYEMRREAYIQMRREAYIRLGLYGKDIEYLNKVMELRPDDKEVSIENYKNRGAAYLKMNLYWLAIADYDEAIKIDPQDAESYLNRSLCYACLDRYLEAIEDLNKYIELKPDDAKGYYLRGKYYKDLSIDDFARAKAMGYEE